MTEKGRIALRASFSSTNISIDESVYEYNTADVVSGLTTRRGGPRTEPTPDTETSADNNFEVATMRSLAREGPGQLLHALRVGLQIRGLVRDSRQPGGRLVVEDAGQLACDFEVVD